MSGQPEAARAPVLDRFFRVGAGMISFAAIAILRGRPREVHPLLALIGCVFAWYFVRDVV
jgi:hypothetical protein